MNNNLRNEIDALKNEKKAVILAHYYQVPEIQEIADYIGDSLGLAQKAANTSAKIILFAGVRFMAETAKILNPEKKVILPDLDAGCSLSDSCPAEKFREFIEKYPGYTVISYINCSAEVKALSDIIVTSGNALKIVDSLPDNEKIIFGPDKNLGAYINAMTGKKMILWDGSCIVHDMLTAEAVLKLKEKYKDARIIAHPECKATVLNVADFVGSTTAMVRFVKNDNALSYIVATETGISYQLQKENPGKKFFIVPADESCACNDCEFMKRNTPEKLYHCLRNEVPEMILPEELMSKAKIPVLRMLELTNKLNQKQ